MEKSHTGKLFKPASDPSSFGSVIVWWESRRIPYNLLVGAVGIVSLILWISVSPFFQGVDDGDFSPALSAVIFAMFANVLYTSGWIVEGTLLLIRQRGSQRIGPSLFKLGLAFSMTMAFLPGLLLTIEDVMKAHRHS